MDEEKVMDEENIEEKIDEVLGGEEITFPKELVEEEEEKVPEEKHKSIFQQILTMGISQKVQLALKGNKEARGILIKEPNKLICSAVIKSPKLTETEVLAFAKSRTVSQDVLRLIVMKKEWMRSKDMVLALVNNPRTPIAISMQLMSRLSDKEVAELAKSKAVPAALSTTAKRMIMQKAHKAQKKGH